MTKQEFIAALRLGIPVYCTRADGGHRIIDPNDRHPHDGYIIVRDEYGTNTHSLWYDQPEAVDVVLRMYANFTFINPLSETGQQQNQ